MYINHKTSQLTNMLKYILQINCVLGIVGKVKKPESSYILILKKLEIDLGDKDKKQIHSMIEVTHAWC